MGKLSLRGNLITAHRKAKGYTKLEMAQLLGISVNTLVKLEAGNMPGHRKYKTLQVLFKTLECAPSELVIEEKGEPDGNAK